MVRKRKAGKGQERGERKALSMEEQLFWSKTLQGQHTARMSNTGRKTVKGTSKAIASYKKGERMGNRHSSGLGKSGGKKIKGAN